MEDPFPVQKNIHDQDFQPICRCEKIHFASSHKQKKDNNKFKRKKNNQNCQKTKLYRSLTAKELKKKHSSRAVGGANMGSLSGEDAKQGSSWNTGWMR